MPERLALTAAHAACAGWLRPAREADLYEGIRGGDGAGAYQGLLRRGRARLHDALAPLAGAVPGDRLLEPQVAALVAMLPELLEDGALDPRVQAVFQRWRSGPGRRRPLLDLLSR